MNFISKIYRSSIGSLTFEAFKLHLLQNLEKIVLVGRINNNLNDMRQKLCTSRAVEYARICFCLVFLSCSVLMVKEQLVLFQWWKERSVEIFNPQSQLLLEFCCCLITDNLKKQTATQPYYISG